LPRRQARTAQRGAGTAREAADRISAED
jgi:hypothetical protein